MTAIDTDLLELQEKYFPGRQIDFYEALAAAQNEMGLGVTVYDAVDGRLLYVNDAICNMHRLSKEEFLSIRSLIDLLAPEWIEVAKQRMARRLNGTAQSDVFVGQVLRKDGSKFWIESYVKPIEGYESKMISLSRDITPYKKAEIEAKEALARVEDLYNKAPCGYHSVDNEGRIIHVNDTLLQWLGYTREEILGRSFLDICLVEDRDLFWVGFKEYLYRPLTADVEWVALRKDGSTFPAASQISVVTGDDGRLLFAKITTFNNSERKRAEEKIKAALAEKEELLHQVRSLQATLSLDGDILFIGPGCHFHTGLRLEDVVDQKWIERIHPEDRSRAAELLELAKKATSPTAGSQANLRVARKSGEYFKVDFRCSPLIDNGRPIALALLGAVV